MNMKRRTSRIISTITLILFVLSTGLPAIGEVPQDLQIKVQQSWTESGTTRTRTIRSDSGAIVSERTYDKASGKFLYEGPAKDQPAAQEVAPEPVKAAEPVVEPQASVPQADAPQTDAPQADAPQAEPKKEEPKKEEKAADTAKPSPIKWDNRITYQARLFSTDKNTAHSNEELFNEKNGIGIQKLDVNRVSDRSVFKFRTEGLGSWNQSFGSDLDYRHEADLHVRAKYRRTDWDFGTVLDPSTIHETMTVDATYDRSELRWRPRAVLTLRGDANSGNSIRAQSNTDVNHMSNAAGIQSWNPGARPNTQSWDPSSRDINLNLFAGHRRVDFSLGYGERNDRDSRRKIMRYDSDFNGLKDVIDLWTEQNNDTRTANVKGTYKFNDKYKFSAAVTTTGSDNEFKTVRNHSDEWFGNLDRKMTVGNQNQDHGWLDGYSRTEEYVLNAQPNSKWDVEGRIERRMFRTRADATLRTYNGGGVYSAAEVSSTYNKLNEGLGEVRADYYGWREVPVYFGYRYIDRSEDDHDSLASADVDWTGAGRLVYTPQAFRRYTTLDTTERMAFIGLRHRFDNKVSVDFRHESGSTDDNNRGQLAGSIISTLTGNVTNYQNLTGNMQTTMGSFDRTRDILTVRAEPSKEVTLSLKLRRDLTDRTDIATQDEKQHVGFFAHWAPKRKFTIGGGYTYTTGEYALKYATYKDKIEFVNLNGTYKFNDRWSAWADYSQSVSGDTTQSDYEIGQLQFRRQFKRGHDASLGYSRRYYNNEVVPAEKFTDNVFVLSYSLPL